ncbi:hypothetical protein THF5H11_20731 [Vibrio jasicida]|nr:hypothetical protein THF5H11_20731 [Vibrio jasicida]
MKARVLRVLFCLYSPLALARILSILTKNFLFSDTLIEFRYIIIQIKFIKVLCYD